MIHALNTWKHYLLGTPFIIQTNHQSIKYFITQTKLFDKKMRWANFLTKVLNTENKGGCPSLL